MAELRLTDYDCTCMRELKISLQEDLRSPEEAQSRLVMPEWLRRTQWRSFWENHDSAYAMIEPPIHTTERFTPSPRSSYVKDGAGWQRYKTAGARSELNRADLSVGFRSDPGRNAFYFIALLMGLVVVLGILLCVYLSG